MNRFSLIFLFCAIAFTAGAQTTTNVQPFGKVDKADLELKECDFEKDANAEVLFDKATVFFSDVEIIYERHVRIKIFNENGKKAGDVHIKYYGGNHIEWVEKLQAQTINNNNGVPEFTKVDKKQIFDKRVDKRRSEISFAFPNLKSGSIIEYQYQILSQSIGNFPDWSFQGELPTRYSEIEAKVPDVLHYKNLVRVTMPYAVYLKDSQGQLGKMALANIPSINDEPHMSSVQDNLQLIQN